MKSLIHFYARSILALSVVLYTGACTEGYFELDTLEDEPVGWNPKWTLPVGYASLTLEDLIEPDSNLIFEENNSVRFVFREDSIVEFAVSDFVEVPSDISANERYEVGIISVEDFSSAGDMTLEQLVENADNQTKQALNDADGTTGYFPPFAVSETVEDTLQSISKFVTINIFEGELEISVTNNLPVPVVAMDFKLIDPANPDLDLTFNYANIPANGTQSKSKSLDGKTMGNQFNFKLLNLNIEGSGPDPMDNSNYVPINLTDKLQFNFMARNIFIESGQAALPEQELEPDTVNTMFDVDNGEQFTSLTTKETTIRFSIDSRVNSSFSIKLKIPSATRNGEIFSETIHISGRGIHNGSFDFSDLILDLATNPDNPYNEMPVIYQVIIHSSGDEIIDFDSKDYADLDITIDDLKFKTVQGYFGNISSVVDEDEFDLDVDFWNDLDGTFTLTDPQIKFDIENSIGIPVTLNLNLTGASSDGTEVGLNPDPLSAPYPQNIAQPYSSETVVYDKNNSNIVNFMSNLPENVFYSGNATANPDGITRDNFVTDTSNILIHSEISFPWQFKAQNLMLKDTADLDVEDDLGQLEEARIILNTVNGFPIDVNLKLVMLAKNTGQRLDSISVSTLIAAGVNQDGEVIKTTESKEEIIVGRNLIDHIVGSDQMIIEASLNTANNGSPVKIYTTNSIAFSIAISADVKPDFE